MKHKIFLLPVIACLIACRSSIKANFSAADTSEIVNKILSDKNMTKDLIPKQDTIYIVKAKFINRNWPIKTDSFNLIYIEPSKKNEDLIDLSPSSFYDKKTKIDFGKISIKNDTAKVSIGLYKYRNVLIYDFELVNKNNKWTIFKVTEKTH